MNAIMDKQSDPVIVAPCGVTELVRGHENWLLERLAPLVREQDVTLDIHSIERIDAAGVAALIKLYGYAREAGRTFSVQNACPHVREILSIVGLEPILVSHSPVLPLSPTVYFEVSAA